jgi:hypothetical protein
MGTGDSGALFERLEELTARSAGLRALIEQYNEGDAALEDVVDEVWANHGQSFAEEEEDPRDTWDRQERLQAERLARADRDGDGRISKLEDLQDQARALHVDLGQTILQQHPDADLDGDGRLSDDELQAFGPRIKSYTCQQTQSFHMEQIVPIEGGRPVHRQPQSSSKNTGVIRITVHDRPADKP